MTSFLFAAAIIPLLGLNTFGGSVIKPVKKVSCTAIRDEPDAPTYGFELIRSSDKKYEARFLKFPGDETAPVIVVHSIENLACRFYSGNRFLFQCEKFGASVESIRLHEDSLSLIANKIQRDRFREIRAIGVEVPDHFLIYRFLHADRCSVRT